MTYVYLGRYFYLGDGVGIEEWNRWGSEEWVAEVKNLYLWYIKGRYNCILEVYCYAYILASKLAFGLARVEGRNES